MTISKHIIKLSSLDKNNQNSINKISSEKLNQTSITQRDQILLTKWKTFEAIFAI